MQPITDLSFHILLDAMDRFLPLSVPFKMALRPLLFEQRYFKGSRILNFKQTQSQLWFLLDGLVREIHVDQETFVEHTSWFWTKGKLICSEPGFFSQEPSDKSIEILEDCMVVVLSYQNWLSLKDEFLESYILTEKLRSFYVRQRLQFSDELLSRSAEDRFIKHKNELSSLFLITKVKYIAEFMSMTPDTLGRLRKQYLR